jgi:UDPglucose 6-dehydrogenase
MTNTSLDSIKIGFLGLSHLGIVTSSVLSDKGFNTICFDRDLSLIQRLQNFESSILEPGLDEILVKNQKKQTFTNAITDLIECDFIYVSKDVSTDSENLSDTLEISQLINALTEQSSSLPPVIILCQVPPGFTRKIDSLIPTLVFYQVETLVFGDAVNRSRQPERYIVGSSNSDDSLPAVYKQVLDYDECPVLIMNFESAELAKIAINLYLASDISLSNSIAEVCEKVGADWSQIVPALRLDRRIGEFAYLRPGLGISGGNIERDLVSILKISDDTRADSQVVKAFLEHSKYQKTWVVRKLENILNLELRKLNIGILGLTYKENTHSIKNSASVETIKHLATRAHLFVYDPIVKHLGNLSQDISFLESPEEVFEDTDVVLILTPWDIFKKFNDRELLKRFANKVIVDPYGVLNEKLCTSVDIIYLTLGKGNN